MIIFPAIDIKDKICVRLVKGDFNTADKVAENALDTALYFEQCGAEYLHMVDLDGAKDGISKNRDIITDVIRNTKLKVDIGGGIRDIQTIEYYLSQGGNQVVLGSAAYKDEEFLKEALLKYNDKIIIGIDAINEKVSISGWQEVLDVDYIYFAKKVESLGVKYITFTDISKDGTLEGPNILQLEKLLNAVKVNIIASGGIKDISHIEKLKQMNVYGAICGKSIYQKTLDLKEAIKVSKS